MVMINSNLPQRIVRYWENRHPVARNALLLTAAMVCGGLLLTLMMYSSPYLVGIEAALSLRILETYWNLLLIVVAAILIYSLIRMLWLIYRQRLNVVDVTIVSVAPLLMFFIIRLMPTFFEASFSFQLKHSYNDAFAQFQALCDEWNQHYRESTSLTFQPEASDLGVYDAAVVRVWHERHTVFADVGDAEFSFGLACVLDGKETPIDTGRFSRYFEYRHIHANYYEFYREGD